MELVKPDIGLLFWMLVMFSVVLFILGKYAWPAILKSLRNREESIRNALQSAERARKEMEQLKADNEVILKEARKERDNIIQEARQSRDSMMEEAKKQSAEETKKMIEQAQTAIENQKEAALLEIKDLVAGLSVDIAEKVLREKLKDGREQKKLIEKLLKEIRVN